MSSEITVEQEVIIEIKCEECGSALECYMQDHGMKRGQMHYIFNVEVCERCKEKAIKEAGQ